MSVFCNPCNRPFINIHSYHKHLEENMQHNYCFRCERDFIYPASLEQHLSASSSHHICPICSSDYENPEDRAQHFRDEHFWCEECNMIWADEQEYLRHREEEHDDYCQPCDRVFNNEHDLKAHFRSKSHRGCQEYCKCGDGFPTVSALFLHIETNTCSVFSSHEFVHIIAVNHGNNEDFLCTFDLEDDIMRSFNNTIDDLTGAYVDDAYDGETYLCYCCDATFNKDSSFLQHLKMASHKDDKVYCYCSNCGDRRTFKWPSGLAQHLESDCC